MNIPPGAVVYVPSAQFTLIAPAGFRLLAAIERAARALGYNVTITSACDGTHSGANDPHHRGCAYDVRTHNLVDEQKTVLLQTIVDDCRDADEGPSVPLSTLAHSLASRRFFGFVEDFGTANEHIHVQLRQGRTYPV
ncbi:MAG: hypothetical protein ACRD1V_17890 [Vicinamibacterales bacterium]